MPALIPGHLFDFGGGRVFTIPPLTLGALRQLQQRLADLDMGSLKPETIDTVVDAVWLALQRNYPELPRADVEQLLDLANMSAALIAVMDISGMRRRQLQAEAEALGNPPEAPVTPAG